MGVPPPQGVGITPYYLSRISRLPPSLPRPEKVPLGWQEMFRFCSPPDSDDGFFLRTALRDRYEFFLRWAVCPGKTWVFPGFALFPRGTVTWLFRQDTRSSGWFCGGFFMGKGIGRRLGAFFFSEGGVFSCLRIRTGEFFFS